jgi:hypothetical protein
MYDDTWDLIGDRGRETIASVFVNDMAEAGLGYARCYRCFTLVPVEFGDLAGQPLAHWVEVAGKTVTRQPCRAHEPVTVGADVSAGEPPVIGAGRKAATRTEPPAARTEPRRPAPGTVTFRQPGGEPVVTSPVPDVPGRSKKGRG